MALTHKHEQVRRVALRSARRAARMMERREKLIKTLFADKDRRKAEFAYILGICQGYRIAKGWIEKKDRKWTSISPVNKYLKRMKFYSRK